VRIKEKKMPKRIVVFGAGGRFNQVLVPQLIADGHTVQAVDIVPLRYECECIEASVVDYAATQRACRGMEIVIHAAALHILPRWPDSPQNYDAYWDANYTGTHNVFLAAMRCGVGKVIYSSSGVYYDMRDPRVVDEDWPACRPAPSIYDLSKVVGEDIARFYAAQHGLTVIALRYGNFVGDPEPSFDFLHARLRCEDAAQANYLSVIYEPPRGSFEPFNVLPGSPFQPEDVDDLVTRPMETLDKYYPGVAAFLEDRAKRMLGYRPHFTFETFLERLGWAF
jgi:nucleoside-diphosphate-sugar epimerase